VLWGCSHGTQRKRKNNPTVKDDVCVEQQRDKAMDVLQNPPLKDEPQGAVVPPVMPDDRPTAVEPRFREDQLREVSSAPHLSNTSGSSQDVNRAGVSKTPEIPIAELRLLAITHGAANGPTTGKWSTRARVHLFIAALVSIGAAVVWQHYGRASTEILSTAIVSPGPFSSSSAAEENAKPEFLPASAPGSDVADSTRHLVTPSAPAADTSSSELERLDAIVRDLAIVRQGLQKLAADQEDLARNVAALQASRDNSKQKPSSSPVSRSTPANPRKTPSIPPPLRADALPSTLSPNTQSPSNQTTIADHRTAPVPRPPSSIRSD